MYALAYAFSFLLLQMHSVAKHKTVGLIASHFVHFSVPPTVTAIIIYLLLRAPDATLHGGGAENRSMRCIAPYLLKRNKSFFFNEYRIKKSPVALWLNIWVIMKYIH